MGVGTGRSGRRKKGMIGDVLVDTSSKTNAAKMRNEPQPARTPGIVVDDVL